MTGISLSLSCCQTAHSLSPHQLSPHFPKIMQFFPLLMAQRLIPARSEAWRENLGLKIQPLTEAWLEILKQDSNYKKASEIELEGASEEIKKSGDYIAGMFGLRNEGNSAMRVFESIREDNENCMSNRNLVLQNKRIENLVHLDVANCDDFYELLQKMIQNL